MEMAKSLSGRTDVAAGTSLGKYLSDKTVIYKRALAAAWDLDFGTSNRPDSSSSGCLLPIVLVGVAMLAFF